MSKLLLAAAAVAAISLGAGPAGAGQRSTTVAAPIAYADLDLSTLDGAAAMLSRINRTVDRLCEPSHSPLNVREPRAADIAACRAEARERAVQNLHAPVVTASYDRSLARPPIQTASK